MNKAELIRQTAEETGYTKKETEEIINKAISLMAKALSEGDKVKLVGFGSFEVKQRAARQGRDLRTGEMIPVPPAKAVQFTAGKTLKEAVK